MNRRDFMKAALAGVAAGPISFSASALAANAQTLTIGTRTIEVGGRAATVYSLLGPDGRPGLTLDAGAQFDVALRNGLSERTMIHWHGLTPPFEQDGVPDLPKPMLEPGETRDYNFPVGEGGTYWMHAHTLQEQNLLAAPLVVRTAEDRAADEQEVVVLLHDFSFTPAEELLGKLKGSSGAAMPMAGAMDHGGQQNGMGMMGNMPMDGSAMNHAMGQGMAGGMMGMAGGMGHMAMGDMDLNDIEYDAYLANDRTLDDPEVVQVDRNGTVRLRIINGAASTAFTIDLGSLDGTLIAVDGQPVVPVSGRRIPLTMSQRADIRVRIPAAGGAFPILALREGAAERTGIVLATAGAEVHKLDSRGELLGPVLDLELESRLQALNPLSERPASRSYMVHLMGNMMSYDWAMAGDADILVHRGERAEVTLMNMSMMAHPMHLHGHHFQVVAINGNRISGAMRDSVLVPPMQSVTFAVDANNPGRWAFHCHHLYHMASGMMGRFAYAGVS
ncbi:Copper resistance protein A precursor [Hartmannibacter diazotrophicus]|uniref:Copper resistance protein A n=1 Tax=Hartmannibacter diazotrophicus TaxID=1482074 RepID=A0A2C9D6K9_9HYPH|nr:multicopper oxidase domain-containing protein [Hartmannibacter diazotrophicus]SON55381.1 Copper resistance protein A precursor [Hartmannibacter diazotrophicus]